MSTTRPILISSDSNTALALVKTQVAERQEFHKKHEALHAAQAEEMEALLEASGVNALREKHKAECEEMITDANATNLTAIQDLLLALGENALQQAIRHSRDDSLLQHVSLDAEYLETLGFAVLEVPAEVPRVH